MNREWGNQLVFSEATLLEFMLDLTDDLPIRLVDFNVEQSSPISTDSSSINDRYHFEIRGGFFATLSFLNAIEQRFPFATLEEVSMVKKHKKEYNLLKRTSIFSNSSSAYGCAKLKHG